MFATPTGEGRLQPRLRSAAGFLLLAFGSQLAGCAAPSIGPSAYFHASQPGLETLDQGSGGGNPFASALIDALTEPTEDLQDFAQAVVRGTEEKSYDFQTPDVTLGRLASDRWSPLGGDDSRVALVFVFSGYPAEGDLPPLEGALRDAGRVERALSAAGFETQVLVDPSLVDLADALRGFGERSRRYDTAVIYTTGHGVETPDGLYLLPVDYDLDQETRGLARGAVDVHALHEGLAARERNLVFYAACRNDPFAPFDPEEDW